MGVTEDEVRSLLFIDLLPYDLCIETEMGYKVVIPKGSTIPCRRSVEVSLSEDNQKELLINVYRKKSKEQDPIEKTEENEIEEEENGLKVSTFPLFFIETRQFLFPTQQSEHRRSSFCFFCFFSLSFLGGSHSHCL